MSKFDKIYAREKQVFRNFQWKSIESKHWKYFDTFFNNRQKYSLSIDFDTFIWSVFGFVIGGNSFFDKQFFSILFSVIFPIFFLILSLTTNTYNIYTDTRFDDHKIRNEQKTNILATTITSSSSSRGAGCQPRVTPRVDGREVRPSSGGPGFKGFLELTCHQAGLGGVPTRGVANNKKNRHVGK